MFVGGLIIEGVAFVCVCVWLRWPLHIKVSSYPLCKPGTLRDLMQVW